MSKKPSRSAGTTCNLSCVETHNWLKENLSPPIYQQAIKVLEDANVPVNMEVLLDIEEGYFCHLFNGHHDIGIAMLVALEKAKVTYVRDGKRRAGDLEMVEAASAAELELVGEPSTSVKKPRLAAKSGRQSRLSQGTGPAKIKMEGNVDGYAGIDGEDGPMMTKAEPMVVGVGVESDDEATEDEDSNGNQRRVTRSQKRNAEARSKRKESQQVEGLSSMANRVNQAEAASSGEPEDEEPEDGVHPRFWRPQETSWMPAAFEGVNTILKLLPIQRLLEICRHDEHVHWPEKVYRYKKRNEFGTQIAWRTRSRPTIAQNITKMVFFGSLSNRRPEDGGTDWRGVDQFLMDFVDDSYIEDYLNGNLKHQVAKVPAISDMRRLLWRLWARKPAPPAQPSEAYIGRVTLPFVHVKGDLLRYWQAKVAEAEFDGVEPYLDIIRVFRATEALLEEERILEGPRSSVRVAGIKNEDGSFIKVEMENEESRENPEAPVAQLALPTSDDPDEVNYLNLLGMLHNLNKHGQGLRCRCQFDLERKLLFVDVTVNMQNRGDILIHCATVRRTPGEEPALIEVWLDQILQHMDHLKDTDIVNRDLESLNVEWDNACEDLETRGIPLELKPPQTLSFNLFDKVMAGVEDLERPMEADVGEFCEENIELRLKKYQKHAISFMYREETAVGGTARHLWLKLPLPGNQPGLQACVSPSLFQLYISKSQILADLTLGTSGGAGWQALEMGMGKTAVILSGTVMNPPPNDWRRPRPWKPYDPEDYYATYVENMPRGGTLVVIPTTLVRQWEIEIKKTLRDPGQLKVLTWTDTHRTDNSKEIAEYDLVLTTPQLATKTSTLTSIYWHRVVIDEAQLNAGALMQSGTLISKHRWIVTGTPCNEDPASLAASLEFLRLGGYHAAQKHLTPALATVLRAVMCRYTKSGKIGNQTNLELPPLVERTLPMTLSGEDQSYASDIGWGNYQAALKLVTRAMRRGGHVGGTHFLDDVISDPSCLNEMVMNKLLNLLPLKRSMLNVKAVVGGGKGVATGETAYNAMMGRDEPIKVFLYSKANAIVKDVLDLRDRSPEAKVLIFSEYADTLKVIAEKLLESELQHRTLIGSTTAKKRGEAIEAFNTDPPTRVFLLQAKSGSVGITLTAASHVYICEPLLNPGLELQAIGRSRRMGQDKQVTVTRVYAQNTLEERLRELLAQRRGGRAALMSTAAAVGAADVKVSAADLINLLKCENPYEDLFSESESEASCE